MSVGTAGGFCTRIKSGRGRLASRRDKAIPCRTTRHAPCATNGARDSRRAGDGSGWTFSLRVARGRAVERRFQVPDQVDLEPRIGKRERVVDHARAPSEVPEHHQRRALGRARRVIATTVVSAPLHPTVFDHSPARTTAGARGERLVIACGGSRGHVWPALAVADAWRRRIAGIEPLLVGPDEPSVVAAVRAAGHRFTCLAAAPFAGQRPGGKARALLLATVGAARGGRRLLRDERAALVLGFGGYASAPVVLAARTLGIPVLLHEANATPGLANRLAARLTSGVLLGFPQTAAELRVPVRVTGTPLRPAIAALARVERTAPAPGATRLVLVSGGSLGSPFLDRRAPTLLARVRASGCALEALHVTGLGDLHTTRAAYAAAQVSAEVVAEIDDIATAYARADAAIVAAGAVTLAEIAAAGIPAVVLPIASAAHDHQTANARAFAAITGADWFPEDRLTDEGVAARLLDVLRSDTAWLHAASGVRRFARPGATDAVVDACLETIERGALPGTELMP